MLKQYLLFLLSLTLLTLPACTMGKLHLTVQFDATEGLQVGDPVVFEQNIIGSVRQVRYTAQGDYLVDIVVERVFRNALTVDSAFYIGSNPTQSRRKALIVDQLQPGGEPLPNRTLVRGTQKPSYWQQMIETLQQKTGVWERELDRQLDELKREYEDKSAEVDRDLDAVIGEMARQLRELQEAMRQAGNSDEARELRRKAEDLLAELQQRLNELDRAQEGSAPQGLGKPGQRP